MPKVSIITASYNYENYIKETIESVMAQTFSDWEMIVVDDGSKDNSVEVIKSYCANDERIKLVQHENGVNKGLAATLQLGISKATGEWLVFLESDDTIEANYLEEKFKVIEKYPEVGLIFNDLNMFGDEERIETYSDYFDRQQKILSKNNFPCSLLKDFQSVRFNLIPTFSVVMVKRELMIDLNYNSFVKPLLDKHLWDQLVGVCKFYYLPKKLSNWCIHKDSYISVAVNDRDMLKFNLQQNAFLYSNYFRRVLSNLKVYERYLKKIKRKYFRFHWEEKEMYLFGKCYRWGK